MKRSKRLLALGVALACVAAGVAVMVWLFRRFDDDEPFAARFTQ